MSSKTKFALAVVMTVCLAFSTTAFAVVRVDNTELTHGENAIGGGKATLGDSALDMANVTAGELYTDQSLDMNFNGGNDIDQVSVAGAAEVAMNFSGENEVEEVRSSGESNVTINANGHNEFEEIEASEQSNMTINVTGENEFEEIVGRDDANITIRGTECQRKDVVELGEGEQDTEITTERGSLNIDHVTVNVKGEEAVVGSEKGDVNIDTAKIGQDDGNKYTLVNAGGEMKIRESVIDVTGTVRSDGQMTIDHSDVKVKKPDSKYGDKSPYRVFSKTGVELIREKNGEVKEGEIDGEKVYYVDTDDGEDVDLEADGDPEYYKCASDDDTDTDEGPEGVRPQSQAKALPKTGDVLSVLVPAEMLAGGLTAVGVALRKRFGR